MGAERSWLCCLSGVDRPEFPIRLLSPVMGLECKNDQHLHVIRVRTFFYSVVTPFDLTRVVG